MAERGPVETLRECLNRRHRAAAAVAVLFGEQIVILEGSGALAFDDAVARVGCPDRPVDRLCITLLISRQPFDQSPTLEVQRSWREISFWTDIGWCRASGQSDRPNPVNLGESAVQGFSHRSAKRSISDSSVANEVTSGGIASARRRNSVLISAVVAVYLVGIAVGGLVFGLKIEPPVRTAFNDGTAELSFFLNGVPDARRNP
jgi:hypothetical protein